MAHKIPAIRFIVRPHLIGNTKPLMCLLIEVAALANGSLYQAMSRPSNKKPNPKRDLVIWFYL